MCQFFMAALWRHTYIIDCLGNNTELRSKIEMSFCKRKLYTPATLETNDGTLPYLIRNPNPDVLKGYAESLQIFRNAFSKLPPDEYMRDGDNYRYRSFGRFYLEFMIDRTLITDAPQIPFVQSNEINAYSGGIERHFPPLDLQVRTTPLMREIILEHSGALPRHERRPNTKRVVEIHLVRIISKAGNPGEPSPEGVHRDGHDFQCITLFDRVGIEGGENEVFVNSKCVCQHTLRNKLETLMFDDRIVEHNARAITVKSEFQEGYRDVIQVSFPKSGG